MPGVLEGIRVIDWTNWLVGPFASLMLAELGAEVIKVENLRTGDPTRGFTRFTGKSLVLPGGKTAYFESANIRKRGIAIDLARQKGKEIMYRMVEKSDVFLQNFRPGVAKQLGMDYETLRQYNPSLIYAFSTPAGLLGPEADSKSVDFTSQARGGAMSLNEQQGVPMLLPVGVADNVSAIMLAYSVLAALIGRLRLGKGQQVTVSQLGSMLLLLRNSVSVYLLTGDNHHGAFSREASENPMFNYYRCSDDRWIALGLVYGDRFWPQFCQVIDKPELQNDARFDSSEKRAQNRKELMSILEQVFAARPCREWENRLGQAEGFIFSRVNDLVDLSQDPQVLENKYLIEMDHPTLHEVTMVGNTIQFSDSSTPEPAPAPEFGQHTEEVLTGVLDYTWDEIAELKAQGVI